MKNLFGVVHTAVLVHLNFVLLLSFSATCMGAGGIKSFNCNQLAKRALYYTAPFETTRAISRPTATSRRISASISAFPKKVLRHMQTRLTDCIRPAGVSKALTSARERFMNKLMERPIEGDIQHADLAQQLKNWKAEPTVAEAMGDLELCVTRIVNYLLQKKLDLQTPEELAKTVKEFTGEKQTSPPELEEFVQNMIRDVWIRRRSDSSQPLVESYLKNEYAMYKRYGTSFGDIAGELSKYTHALTSLVSEHVIEVKEAGSSLDDSYSLAAWWYEQASDTIMLLRRCLMQNTDPAQTEFITRQFSQIKARCGDVRVFKFYHACALNEPNAEEILEELLEKVLNEWDVNKTQQLFDSTDRIYKDLVGITASSGSDSRYQHDPLIPDSPLVSGPETKRAQRKSVQLGSSGC